MTQMMTHRLFALSLGFAAMMAATQQLRADVPTPAATQCGARAGVTARLAEAYGETRRAIGLAANDTMIEVYASDETGTWTVTVTLPDGTTCLVASGHHYQEQPAARPAKGSDA